MEKNYYQITDCPTLLANLVFDTLITLQQYALKNRVMTIKPRLTHSERKLVKDESGSVLDVETLIETCLNKHGIDWLTLVFKDGMTPRLADFVRFAKGEGMSPILRSTIDEYVNLSFLAELVTTLTVEELMFQSPHTDYLRGRYV